MLGITPVHVQDIDLGIVELHDVLMSLPLEPDMVPLDGISSLQRVDCTAQPGVGKLAWSALDPVVHVADKQRC